MSARSNARLDDIAVPSKLRSSASLVTATGGKPDAKPRSWHAADRSLKQEESRTGLASLSVPRKCIFSTGVYADQVTPRLIRTTGYVLLDQSIAKMDKAPKRNMIA
jgi:hypothetical protein